MSKSSNFVKLFMRIIIRIFTIQIQSIPVHPIRIITHIPNVTTRRHVSIRISALIEVNKKDRERSKLKLSNFK